MSLLTFQLQSGAFRETIIVDGPEVSMKVLREKANNFINQKVRAIKYFYICIPVPYIRIVILNVSL